MRTVLARKATYDYAPLKETIAGMLDVPGGPSMGSGTRVLIKPNFLAPAAPERAMLTHPLVLRAVAEYALERGARVQISDSHAMGTFGQVLRDGGFSGALSGLDVECREFSASTLLDIGDPFGKIEVARDVLEADVVINLPKLKTHTQMLLTLGVKNLFGCIVGLRKPEWHLRTGVDREMFALLLVRLCVAIKPAFTLLDGILAMEGQGPGKRGTPRTVDMLLGGSDPFAVDEAVCRMVGISPGELLTLRIAKELGIADGGISIDGDLPVVSRFRLPKITPLVFRPKLLRGLMRRHLVQRPVVDRDSCRLCGECWKYCPAKAIAHNKAAGKVVFDYEACIRCYCCIEVCPHAALSAQETVPGKVLRKVIKSSRRAKM